MDHKESLRKTMKYPQNYYDQMQTDHSDLFKQLQSLRSNPSSVIPQLIERIERYRKRNDEYYLFSNVHKKKAVKISEKEQPKHRINELIKILSNHNHSQIKLIEVSKLYECASKISQTICQKLPSSINFKTSTTQLLREIIDEDQFMIFPNKIVCLISVSFHESHDPLLNLLVDDDVPRRENRKILLDQTLKYVGLCSAIPIEFEYLKCTVFLLTDKVLKKQRLRNEELLDQNKTQRSNNYKREDNHHYSYRQEIIAQEENEMRRSERSLKRNSDRNQEPEQSKQDLFESFRKQQLQSRNEHSLQQSKNQQEYSRKLSSFQPTENRQNQGRNQDCSKSSNNQPYQGQKQQILQMSQNQQQQNRNQHSFQSPQNQYHHQNQHSFEQQKHNLL